MGHVDRAEPGDGLGEAVLERDLRLPAKPGFGEGDIGPPAGGIVRRQGLVDDFGFRAGELNDLLGELPDGELAGVADVAGAGP